MSWREWLDWLGLLRDPQREAETLHFALDEPAQKFLLELAQRERASAEDVAASLLSQALNERLEADRRLSLWHSLSPREQQVAALICLGQTNRQMATRLGLSPETVKTHVKNLLSKFSLRSKTELARYLAGWDFKAWE